jgi:formate dehydrogenase assembly factor FdhD
MIDIEELKALVLRLAVMTDIHRHEIIDALIGTCWDEEMAGTLKGRNYNEN